MFPKARRRKATAVMWDVGRRTGMAFRDGYRGKARRAQPISWLESAEPLPGVVLESELSVKLCVKSTCQTQRRCHGGHSSAGKVLSYARSE